VAEPREQRRTLRFAVRLCARRTRAWVFAPDGRHGRKRQRLHLEAFGNPSDAAHHDGERHQDQTADDSDDPGIEQCGLGMSSTGTDEWTSKAPAKASTTPTRKSIRYIRRSPPNNPGTRAAGQVFPGDNAAALRPRHEQLPGGRARPI
jgi:hypothetical protein